ncbi:MAG: class C beta-lactamase-related serine hydrolase [Caldilinea sp. CFX5]|nr:class C beta-lactamase-related serine hydrolase [Caldilinea sp. CFX5]
MSSRESAYWPDGDWRTATPEEQGFDSAVLEKLLQTLTEEQKNINALLLVRNGYLVLEIYFPPYRRDIPHDLASATKSITSLLIGAARDDGLLPDLNRPVLDYFADVSLSQRDRRKARMTLGHLLAMTDGLKWPEGNLPHGSRKHMITRLAREKDWVHFILDQPMAHAPGTRFNYNSGASHLLSALIERQTGQTLAAYAMTRLFAPLAIAEPYWVADPMGITLGGWGLHLTPYDLTKIGYLALRGGQWQKAQVISAAWLADATSAHVPSIAPRTWSGRLREVLTTPFRRKGSGAPKLGFGYHWWIPPFGGFAARGYGGQALFVMPQLDLVAVFSGGLRPTEAFLPEKLMADYILPAMHPPESRSAPRPPLAQRIEQLMAAVNAREAWSHPLSPTAYRIANRMYQFKPNAASLGSVCLRFEQSDEAELTLVQHNRKMILRIGLDGNFRANEFDPWHTVVMRGTWVDEQTFVVQSRPLATGDKFAMKFIFSENHVDVASYSLAQNQHFRLRGRAVRPE